MRPLGAVPSISSGMLKPFSRTRALLLVGVAAAIGGLLGVPGAGVSSAGQVAPGALVEFWNGTSWTRQSVFSPDGTGVMTAVTAVSATDAWALGSYGTGGVADVYGNALAEHWNGSSWQQVAMPNPTGSNEVRLGAVGALSAGNVWAVGASAGPVGGYSTLIEHWDGSSWAVVPSPSAGESARLSALAALSARNVWAVGRATSSAGGSAYFHPLVLHWNGIKWKRVASPLPGNLSAGLSGVAAVSPRSVWAVGEYQHVQKGRILNATLALHWNGHKWKRVPSPNSSGGNGLSAVAVVGRNNVWAVGHHGRPPSDRCNCGGIGRLLAEHWNGHAWRIVPARSGYPNSETQGLTGLAVISARNIWAIGYHQDTDLRYYGLVEHWHGTTWAPIPSLNPDADTFSGIAAPSPAAVWAVGVSSAG